MPENETLLNHARSASRRRSLGEGMDGGMAPTEVFPAIQNQLYALFQNVWRQRRARGVDAAPDGPDSLHELIRQTRNDQQCPTPA
jgi:hypothetical protein